MCGVFLFSWKDWSKFSSLLYKIDCSMVLGDSLNLSSKEAVPHFFPLLFSEKHYMTDILS